MVRTIRKSMTRGFSIRQAAEIALNGALDVTEEIVDAGRKAYCNLHQNHPAWTVARKFSDRSIILRAIDQMCEDDGYNPPPLPEPEFTGGQCCDGSYTVGFTFTQHNADERNPRQPVTNTGVNIAGKIIGGQLRRNPSNENVAEAGIVAEDCNGNQTFIVLFSTDQGLYTGGNAPPVNLSEPYARGWHASFTTLSIDGITRNDGQPDDCGNPPAEYPPEEPPSDGDLTQIVNITNNAGDSYDYSVTVNRDGDDTINFPPVVVVNNVAMTLDITGINILSNNNTNKFSGGGSGGVAEEEPKELEEDTKGKELVVDIGTIEEDVTQLYGVIVKFASIPFNAKLSGGNGAPKIIYGGWVEFKIGANYLPRQYIDFMNSYFLAPEGATGYAVTVKVGYNATIFKAYYRDIEDGSESDN